MKMIHKGWLHGRPLSDDIKQLFADASEWGATLSDAGQAAIGQLLMFAETEHRRANLSQQLHDLEIPGGTEWTYDGAWRVWIGNPLRDEAMVGSEAEAMTWLAAKAQELYDVDADEEPAIHLSPEELLRLQREKNCHMRSVLDGLMDRDGKGGK